jgi:lipid-A-disaccharide synthase
VSGLLPTIKLYRHLSTRVADADALLLADFPEVNLRLMKLAKKHGVPVVYLAPPQAWAWRPWRSKLLMDAHYVGCLFRFSCEWYQSRGVNADWLGHPLAQEVPPTIQRGNQIAIMPGSRVATIKRILPDMIRMAESMTTLNASLRFTLVRAEGIPETAFAPYLSESSARLVISTDVESTLNASVIALTHPGTATLHAALRGCIPFVMCNPARLTYWVGSRLIRVPYLSLPNLILKAPVFPEFILGASDHKERIRSAIQLYEEASHYESDLKRVWELCRNRNICGSPEKAFGPLFT